MPGAKAIFVGGTASHAGKSWMVTAICRYLHRRGARVAPFKAQNMSNNSYPCAGGGEIGRAQVVQAEACGLAPEPDMNPVLLKPTSNQGSQVVVNGRVWENLSARDYYEHHRYLREQALAAYERLAARFDYIVIEGAGSVAELNLRDRDFVNLAMARAADAPALLVADIDRGGVFASILGTLCVLPPEDRALIRAFAVNRFRGDAALFEPGVRMIESAGGKPCLGVFPMLEDARIQEEDGVALEEAAADPGARIAVVRLPHISNFTDFRLLRCAWIQWPDAREFDWIILPGTKNTIGDLEWLRARGLDRWIAARHRAGARVLGVCGGYQMLGESIEDPHGVEGPAGRAVPGLGMLPVRTTLERDKVTRVTNATTPNGVTFTAYEIHMGRTERTAAAPDFLGADGCQRDGVFGTYLHGALENPAVASEFFGETVAHALVRAASRLVSTPSVYDRLADWFESHANTPLFEELFL
jgi:adenosylcobyric acid synthase